jgi:hypothetical protein
LPGYPSRSGLATSVAGWPSSSFALPSRPVAPANARLQVVEALRLWQGSAYAEFPDEPWAANEAIRIKEVRRIATEALATVTLRSGQPAEAASLAEMLVSEHPLREESWRLLAVALWGNNRSADALAALRRAREVFATELGIEVGPTLAELELDILGQRMAALHDALDLDRTAPLLPSLAAHPRSTWQPPRWQQLVTMGKPLKLLADAPPLRPDFSIFATLPAGAVTALGRRDLAEELYTALLPIRHQLAGVASTSLTMGRSHAGGTGSPSGPDCGC